MCVSMQWRVWQSLSPAQRVTKGSRGINERPKACVRWTGCKIDPQWAWKNMKWVKIDPKMAQIGSFFEKIECWSIRNWLQTGGMTHLPASTAIQSLCVFRSKFQFVFWGWKQLASQMFHTVRQGVFPPLFEWQYLSERSAVESAPTLRASVKLTSPARGDLTLRVGDSALRLQVHLWICIRSIV